jgi:tetratricopeptide (TPR) repeat protein
MTDTAGAAPDPSSAAFERIRLLIDARRPSDAIQVAQAALRSDPGDPRLTAALGWALLASGDAPGARSWVERSLGIDPDQAWVHNLRAMALLSGAGKPEEARSAAAAAVARVPAEPSYLYTLVRACLACRDRAGAQATAGALARTAPASYLRPLAQALVELDKAGVYGRRRRSAGVLVALIVLTRGAALVIGGVWWIVHLIRRAPHLRKADVLLREALSLQPTAGAARSVAADVLKLRFRFAQAVEHELASAALDSGLVDAFGLAADIARRTAGAILGATAAWVFIVALADSVVSSDLAMGVAGLSLGALAVGFVVRFDRWQAYDLPPRLGRDAHRRWPPVAAAAIPTVWLLVAGLAYLDDDEAASGYQLASLVTTPVVILGTAALVLRFLGARFGNAPRPGRRARGGP